MISVFVQLALLSELLLRINLPRLINNSRAISEQQTSKDGVCVTDDLQIDLKFASRHKAID